MEFVGNNLKFNATAASSEECRKWCEDDYECTAWAFYTAQTPLYKAGTCNTFMLVLAAYPNPAVVSAFKTGQYS